MKIIDKIRQTIKQHAMLTRGDHVLIGLSGGPDSVCLLHILTDLIPSLDLTIEALYVDHGLRPEETAEEIAFCRSLCKDLDVNFTVKSIQLKDSPLVGKLGKQGAARELRYEAFESAAFESGAEKIALAHHKTDQAETLLINLLRGSGMTGLAGIPPCRGKIIRPLIDIKKEEVLDYLSENKTQYKTDSSNLADDYLRNKVRSRIIPELAELNPDIVETLSRTSEILRQENDHIEAEATKTMLRLFSRRTDTRIELFLTPMETMPVYLLRRILRRAADAAKALRSLSFQNIEDIIGIIKNGKSGNRIYLPHDLRAIRDYSVLIITSETPARLKTYSLDIGDEVVIEEAQIVMKATKEENPVNSDGRSSAVFDLDKISLPLTIRPREDGDFFLPSGFGKKKKLQDLFVDEKVPRDERDTVPLICSGKDIVWVVGFRTDDRFIPRDGTKNFLVITSSSTK